MHQPIQYPDFIQNLFEKLWEELQFYQKLLQDKKAIISYSGGKDSTFLLHFYFFLYQKSFIPKPYLYHLNHKIRDNATQEQKIQNYIESNFPFEIIFKKRKVAKLSQKLKLSLEQTGRFCRRKDLSKILNQNTYVTTAHHLNDYIETLIINFIRGAGKSSLETLAIFQENYFRPLMLLDSNSWSQFLSWDKLLIFEDETNQSSKFLRNRIRKNILPLLLKEGLQPQKIYRNFHSNFFFPPKIKPKQQVEKLEISTENFHFYSMQDFKTTLDIYLKIMSYYPLSFQATEFLQRKISEKRSFTFYDKQVIFWKSTNYKLFLMSKKAAFFQKAKMFDNVLIWNHQKNHEFYFDKLAESYEGLKITHHKCRKQVSEILRQNEIPFPVRKYIPILLRKQKVIAILLSMWDNKKQDIVDDSMKDL